MMNTRGMGIPLGLGGPEADFDCLFGMHLCWSLDSGSFELPMQHLHSADRATGDLKGRKQPIQQSIQRLSGLASEISLFLQPFCIIQSPVR
jgi:hypothetical protein